MYKYKKQIFAKVNEYVKKSQEKAKRKVGNYNPIIFKGIGNLCYGAVRAKVKIKLTNNVGDVEKPSIIQ